MRYRILMTVFAAIGLCGALAGCGNGSPSNVNIAGSWTLVSYTTPNGATASCTSVSSAAAKGAQTAPNYPACSEGATFAATTDGTFTYSLNSAIVTSGTYTVYSGNNLTTVFTVAGATTPATYTENSIVTNSGTALTIKLLSSTYPPDQPYIDWTETYTN
jgi:hypothetical protein